MSNKKAVDMANLRLAISENNKKVKECVQSSEKTLQDQVNELKQSAVTPEERASWNNQNAFSAIIVENTKVEAQNITDTLKLVAGDNVALVPDPDSKQIIIKAEDTKYTHPDSGVSAGTYRNVTVDEHGHVVAGDNPTTLAGYGITDAEPKGTANSTVSSHNTATNSHNDIRLLITELTNKLNALANSDDTTLDQMKEVVAYIKDNRTLIESVTTNKVNVSDIINNLTTNISNQPLSAAQGVIIKGLIDALENIIENHMDNTTVHVTSTERTNWDDANAKKHSHSNKSVLDKITGIDTALNASSENPVQNKVIHAEVEALKKSVSDGKTAVANAITGKGVTTATDAAFATMATNINNIKTLSEGTADATATAAQILKDKVAYVKGSKITGAMPNNGAVAPDALEAGDNYTIPEGYHNGSGKVTVKSLAELTADADATAAQILSGKKAYVDGSLVTGSMPNRGTVNVTVKCGSGYYIPNGYHSGFGKVTPEPYPNGTAWTASTGAKPTATGLDSGSVYYDEGMWVAGDRSYPTSNTKGVYYSIDGLNWTLSNLGSATLSAYNIRKGGGIWVIASNKGFYYSTDGKTWTKSNITSGSLSAVCVAYANGMWVGSNSGGLYYSLDGKTWTLSNTTLQFTSVYNANGLWVVTSQSNGIYYSTDGKTWTKSGTSHASKAVSYANGIWVSSGTSPNQSMYYSLDGKTWTLSNLTLDRNFFTATFGRDIWVVANNSYGAYYSTDGKTWTQSDITSGTSFHCVVYGSGIWLMSKDFGEVYYSLDGKTWTYVSSISPKVFLNDGTKWVAILGNGSVYYSYTWQRT